MNTPPGLCGAALLFWGWQTGWLALAVPLAVALELRHFVRSSWSFDAPSINRVADLSSLALLAVGAYFLLMLETPRAARTVLGMAQWLPLTLAPLVFVQAYATRTPLDVSVIFLTLRNRPSTGVRVDFGFLYVIACVLAAAAANVRTEMFYAGVAVFAAWSLWNLRSRRYPRIVPFAMLIAASVLGYIGHVMLNHLQSALTEWASDFADSAGQTNPYRARTDIGHIGELKLSDRILLRARVQAGERTPLLLHRASYNTFAAQAWSARRVKFEPLTGDPASGWSLDEAHGQAANREAAVEVLEHTRSGKAVLSLPSGTAHIAGLPPAEVRHNRLGSVSVDTGPGFLRYRAFRRAQAAVEGAPDEHDTALPQAERAALRDIATRLGLYGISKAEARERIERFFAESFRYSTWQEAAPQGVRTPLAAFLTKTRAGHCEYFATATVLLLREAGIPARYATGFSVQESSGARGYVVRERHAHAWARAWLNGQWIDIDTTPPQWFVAEASQASAWQAFGDAWAWLKFTWGRWQTSEEDTIPRTAWLLLVAALFLWLAWRIAGGLRKRAAAPAASTPGRSAPASDSEFYRIERALSDLGFSRGAGEPVMEWLARLSKSGTDASAIDAQAIDELRAMARLHYALRFDPASGDPAIRENLRERVARWMERPTSLTSARPNGACPAPAQTWRGRP